MYNHSLFSAARDVTVTSVFVVLVEAVVEARVPLFGMEEVVFFGPTLPVDVMTVVFVTPAMTLRAAGAAVL